MAKVEQGKPLETIAAEPQSTEQPEQKPEQPSSYNFNPVNEAKKQKYESYPQEIKDKVLDMLNNLSFWDKVKKLDEIGEKEKAGHLLLIAHKSLESGTSFAASFYNESILTKDGKYDLGLLEQAIDYTRYHEITSETVDLFNLHNNARNMFSEFRFVIPTQMVPENKTKAVISLYDIIRRMGKVEITIEEELKKDMTGIITSSTLSGHKKYNIEYIESAAKYAISRGYNHFMTDLIERVSEAATQAFKTNQFKDGMKLIDALSTDISSSPKLREALEKTVIPSMIKTGNAKEVNDLRKKYGLSTKEDEQVYELFNEIIGD